MSAPSLHLLFAAVFSLVIQTAGPVEASRVFTDRDLDKYKREQTDTTAAEERQGRGPESLWPGIETWLELNEVENLIERTKGDRDRQVRALMGAMEAEKADCTGVVGAEYRFEGGVYGILVNATARKSCELAVERKYDALMKDTLRSAGERLESLSARRRELEERQRGLR